MDLPLDFNEEILKISQLNMTEQARETSPDIKNEFTEVFTASDLLSPCSSVPSEFPVVVTETSILESSTSSDSTEAKDLVALYDEVFPTPLPYFEFVDNKLAIWKDSVELKYFNTLYMNHRHSTETIKNLRSQAQALLEEANRMQGRHRLLKQELDQYISNIPQGEFRR